MSPDPKPVQHDQAGILPADFEVLLERHWDPICLVLSRLLGDWDEAQDIALEAFLALYQRPPRDQQNLAGWLYRVATNLGFNALRARTRRRKYEDQAGLEALQTSAPGDPAQSVESMVEQQAVRMALVKLKPRSRSLLLLRYSDFSYAEIAAVLEVAPGSVGTLLARAEKEFEAVYCDRKDVKQ